MPTNPPPNLFNPHFNKAQVKPLLDIAVPLLTEVLNYGLSLFARCGYRPAGDDENLPILFVYRHLLEMLDSVIIQIAECAPAPAALQLRAIFDALLTIEYMLEHEGKVRERAFAYIYNVQLERKRTYLSLDPSTLQGKAFLKAISDDPYSKDLKSTVVPDLAGRLKEIDEILQKPELAAAAQAYQKAKKAVGRKPNWYTLYDGPRNLGELARHLKRGAQYEILYKEWAERGHSIDAIDRILIVNSDGSSARGLRDATELESTVDFAIAFAVDAARRLIDHYRSGEQKTFAKWYLTEVSPKRKGLPRLIVDEKKA
jgi:hypothetical protein